MTQRKVSLFRNGRSQAIRIPKEFELPGREALIWQEENGRLVLEPLKRGSLVEYLKTKEPLGEDFPEIEDRPPEPVEL